MKFMSDFHSPSAIDFWDYCRSLNELASEHWSRVRTIQTRYDLIDDDWDEKKAEEDFRTSVTDLLGQFESLDTFHGFPEFGDMHSMYLIVVRMAALLRRAIIHRDLNYGLFGGHEDDWQNANFELHQSINYCAQNHPEIHQVIYQRALSDIELTELKPCNDNQSGTLPKLSKKKRMALEIIKKNGPILGKQIAKLLLSLIHI